MVAFSTLTRNMRSSEIRRLMQLAADPKIISFAGGMPNNALFPTDLIAQLWQGLDEATRQAAFQYCPTAGYPPLLSSLRDYLSAKGIDGDGKGLIVTTGAQQALNLVAKVMLDPGDTVVTEYPSFIGAVAAFRSFGARLRGVAMDSDGILVDKLGELLNGLNVAPKFAYVSPCFHNPAGIIYSEARKRALLSLLVANDMCLLEDDPYGELYFDEDDRGLTRPMAADAPSGLPVCYAGSFAKIFGPGMRLGWLLAPEEIIEKCELAKQSMDACSSTFTQVLAHAYLSGGHLPGYLAMLRTTYRRRASIMLEALETHMPAGVTWTRPRGGFYVWVNLPEGADATAVFKHSLDNGAAFVIGSAFDPDGQRNDCFRLAFSHTPEERIAEGVKIVCDAVVSVLGTKTARR